VATKKKKTKQHRNEILAELLFHVQHYISEEIERRAVCGGPHQGQVVRELMFIFNMMRSGIMDVYK
jgi:hypothetical protein